MIFCSTIRKTNYLIYSILTFLNASSQDFFKVVLGTDATFFFQDRDATPYLERNRLRPPNADAVDAAGALTDMGKYLYREHRLPTYDLAVVITKLDMCRRRFPGGRCNRGTAGK